MFIAATQTRAWHRLNISVRFIAYNKTRFYFITKWNSQLKQQNEFEKEKKDGKNDDKIKMVFESLGTNSIYKQNAEMKILNSKILLWIF